MSKPATTRSSAYQRRVLVTAGIGYGLVILDRTIVNVALPTIGVDLGAGTSALQWVVDGYVLVLAGLLLSGGALCDRIGTLRAFRVAVGLFTVTSLLCGAAPNAGLLVAARMGQGVGAALLIPASWAMIARAFPDTVQRAKALAVWSAMAGSPQALGPTVGGVVVSVAGWRAIFLLNLPLGALTWWLSRPARHDAEPGHAAAPEHRRGLDLGGQATAVVLLSALTLALIAGGDGGWLRPLPLLAGVVALTSAAVLVRVERRAADPLLPPELLRAPGLVGFTGVGVLLFFGYYGLMFALSLRLGRTADYDALRLGLTLLPAALPIVAVPPLATRLVALAGPRRVVIAGAAVAAVGCAGLAVVGDGSDPVVLGAVLLVLGIGSGLAFLPQAALVLAATPTRFSGVSSGLMNASRQSGSMLGVAVLGLLAAGPRVGGGLEQAALTAGAVMALVVGVALWNRAPVPRRRDT